MSKETLIEWLNDLVTEIKENQKPENVLVDLYAHSIVSEFRKNRNGDW